MSRMSDPNPERRRRGRFTDEFKAGAVRLVPDEGKTVGAAARDWDLTPSALADGCARPPPVARRWTGLTGVEREELARLCAARSASRARSATSKRSRGFLRERSPAKFVWIHAEEAHHPVRELCSWLGATTSGYYASCVLPASGPRDTRPKVEGAEPCVVRRA